MGRARVWRRAGENRREAANSYYESEGRTFESFRARHSTAATTTFPLDSPIQMSKSPWRRSTSRSRDGNPPELLLLASPSSRGGRRECRVQAAPMARLQQKSRRQSPQVQPEHPAFPARWFTAYTCSPRCAGLFCHRRLANVSSQDLISASGDQDHTISLVRAPSLVLQGNASTASCFPRS